MTPHRHKTNHRRFDGYKGHVAIDPEIVTVLTPGSAGDASVAEDHIEDLLDCGASFVVQKLTDADPVAA